MCFWINAEWLLNDIAIFAKHYPFINHSILKNYEKNFFSFVVCLLHLGVFYRRHAVPAWRREL